MGFFTRLASRAQQIDSLLCVGLDPHSSDLSAPTPDAARAFCLRLIEATADLAVAYKPNAAFFEAFGPQGLVVLQDVIAAVPSDVPVVLDAKRGDIASSADAYVTSAFHLLKAHAATVNPYLGRDSVDPWIQDPQYGVFLLCKTSNPGASDLQDLRVGEQKLYEVVAHLAQEWNTRDNLGLVVGATHPDSLAAVRRVAPDLWFLSPGVGAQGGDLRAALNAGLRQDGLGMLMPVSRAISRSAHPRQAAQDLRDQINAQRGDFLTQRPISPVISPQFAQLADGLLEAGCVKFGQFTLKSGLQSPIYLDLRQLVGYPRLLEQVGQAYRDILVKLDFDRLAALPYAALPIATSVSLLGGWPMIYPRKEPKEYGTRAAVEGVYAAGEKVAVVDDLATTGGSKFEAIEKLTAAGLRVEDVVVLIDRQSGAAEALAQSGYRLHAVFTFSALLDYWEAVGKVPPDRIAAARAFIAASQRS